MVIRSVADVKQTQETLALLKNVSTQSAGCCQGQNRQR